MTKKYDLTHGDIFKTLTRLALPIMGTSFIQMAYNLIDMLWIGRVGRDSVAAKGQPVFYWLAQAVIALADRAEYCCQKIGEKRRGCLLCK